MCEQILMHIATGHHLRIALLQRAAAFQQREHDTQSGRDTTGLETWRPVADPDAEPESLAVAVGLGAPGIYGGLRVRRSLLLHGWAIAVVYPAYRPVRLARRLFSRAECARGRPEVRAPVAA